MGNLSWEASWQDLKDHMRGPNQDLSVSHVDILQESSGRSKGCAIVEYISSEVMLGLLVLSWFRTVGGN